MTTTSSNKAVNRRKFLKLAGAAGIAALGLGYIDMDQTWINYDAIVEGNKNMELKNTNDKYKNLIHYATLAASGHNTQPWHFSVNGNRIQIQPDKTRQLPVVDPQDRELWISLGCALENLLIAARQVGYQAEVTYPDANDLIEINLSVGQPSQSDLFGAITSRQNTRSAYDGRPIKPADFERLNSLPMETGVSLRFLNNPAEMDLAASFVNQGTLLQYTDKSFVNELIAWLRFNKKEALASRDGLYSRCSGNPDVPRFIGKLFVSGTKPQQQADADIKKLKCSSGAVVLISTTEDKAAWVRTGQVYERLALTMTSMGIKSALLNQPIEIPEVRSKFQQALGLGPSRPQLLVRYGYAPVMASSMRRPVEEVIEYA